MTWDSSPIQDVRLPIADFSELYDNFPIFRVAVGELDIYHAFQLIPEWFRESTINAIMRYELLPDTGLPLYVVIKGTVIEDDLDVVNFAIYRHFKRGSPEGTFIFRLDDIETNETVTITQAKIFADGSDIRLVIAAIENGIMLQLEICKHVFAEANFSPTDYPDIATLLTTYPELYGSTPQHWDSMLATVFRLANSVQVGNP